jgi:tetratricopeptide (TPR) repeat protein
LKLQKQDEAIAALKKAAALDPSALNQYNLCGVAYTAQKYNEAKAPCNKYLELEPTGAHAEEVKAFLAEIGQK